VLSVLWYGNADRSLLLLNRSNFQVSFDTFAHHLPLLKPYSVQARQQLQHRTTPQAASISVKRDLEIDLVRSKRKRFHIVIPGIPDHKASTVVVCPLCASTSVCVCVCVCVCRLSRPAQVCVCVGAQGQHKCVCVSALKASTSVCVCRLSRPAPVCVCVCRLSRPAPVCVCVCRLSRSAEVSTETYK